MAGDYKKIMAWQLSDEMTLLVYTKEFQKSEIE
jgi:hypothetical protein